MPEAEAPAAPAWLTRHADVLRAAADAGAVLDLACGRGRAALAAARLGARVLALDRDASALRALAAAARGEGLRGPWPLRVDLEDGRGIPVRPGSCAAILVFRFLFRPLAGAIQAALRPGGWLLYETFTTAQRERPYGPSNPAFLLEPGELPRLFPALTTMAHEESWTDGPRPFAVARLAARRPPEGDPA